MNPHALLVSCLLTLLAVLPAGAQEYFPVNGTHNHNNHRHVAFTNATLAMDYQTIVENATLLIKDGKVVAAGTEVEVPKDAMVEDLQGKHIYPSFIDLDSDYGMPEMGKKGQGWPKHPQ